MTDAEPWQLVITAPARKEMRKLDPPVRRRVAAALQDLLADPGGAPNIRKLTGRYGSRMRVGDWRVIFEMDRKAREIVIHHVLPRGRAYDR